MKLFTSQDANWWTGAVFISCLFWRHPFIHCRGCWASDIMLHFSKSVLMKKQTHLHLGWPQKEYILVNYSFKNGLLKTSQSDCSVESVRKLFWIYYFLKAHTSVFVISYFIDELLFWNVGKNRCFKTFEWLFITVLSAGNTKTNIKPADKSETLTAIAKTEAAFRHSSGFMEG